MNVNNPTELQQVIAMNSNKLADQLAMAIDASIVDGVITKAKIVRTKGSIVIHLTHEFIESSRTYYEPKPTKRTIFMRHNLKELKAIALILAALAIIQLFLSFIN